jgi:hypothetical protein
METFTVTAKLTISHTDTVEANSEEEAWEIISEWIDEDFTEDSDCSRSWVTTIS